MLRAEPQYYGAYVAFDYVKTQTTFLDEAEFKILRCLCGKFVCAEEVARETKISHGKCKKFLKRATEIGLVRQSGVASAAFSPENTNVKREIFAKFPVPFLSAPSSVDVFITSRCNLKCGHCFSATSESADLPLEALKSIFDQLEKMGVFEVRINGGEPLMHQRIGEIFQLLEQRHFRKLLITNGTLLSDAIAEQLKKADVTPTVSLDDSDAKGHDLFRGVDGAFERTLAGLEILRKHGIQFGVNCCLHTKNLHKAANIVDFAARQGAYRIALLDLEPIGRMNTPNEWMPSPKEYETALAHLMFLKAKHRRIDVSLDVFLFCPDLRESRLELKRGYVSCRAGRTVLSIFSDGCVYPCNVAVGDPKWRMGDLKNEALEDIWFSMKWAFFRGGVKVNDLEKCRSCKERKRCRDIYCRMLPYATTGNPFGSGMFCSKI